MTKKKQLIAFALAGLMATATRAEAQVHVSAGCSPGIPSCTSLRFFIDATGGVSIDQLFITMLSPAWRFTPGGSPDVGTYSAQDSFGPFSGFTTIGGGGSALMIDFLANGF